MFRLILIIPVMLLLLTCWVFLGTSWGVMTFFLAALLAIPTLISFLVLYFGVCLVLQGKKAGGMSDKEAWKELGREFFAINKFKPNKTHAKYPSSYD